MRKKGDCGRISVMLEKMLKAGAHFGYSRSKRHPKMKPFIFSARNGTEIFDLEKTEKLLEAAREFVKDMAKEKKIVLFVGTKKESRDIIEQAAKELKMPYVTERWLGGIMTNFKELKGRIDHLNDLLQKRASGEMEKYTKKERVMTDKKIAKLEIYLGGLKDYKALPSALIVIDPNNEKTAVKEARQMKIPLISVMSSDCNPEEVDFPIPANDDAVRAVRLICSCIASAVLEGRQAREMAAMVYEEESVKEVMTFTPEGGFGTASEMAAATKAAEVEAAAKAANPEAEPAQQAKPTETEPKKEDHTAS